LREYLETGYVSLADYMDPECAALLREYARAGEEFAADRRMTREKLATDAWQRLSEQSRLAGELARAIGDEAERLRHEFRSWRALAPAGWEALNADGIPSCTAPNRPARRNAAAVHAAGGRAGPSRTAVSQAAATVDEDRPARRWGAPLDDRAEISCVS